MSRAHVACPCAEPSAAAPATRAVRARAPSFSLAPLQISSPGDAAEREADRAADRVIRGERVHIAAAPVRTLARACAQCDEEEREAGLDIRRKPVGESVHIDRAPPTVAAALRAGGRPLDPAARAYFEPRFGADFADVRIHADSAADAAARAIDARAFTLGRRIGFAAGEYAPDTAAGQRLLAHELAHVAQSRGEPIELRRQVSGCAQLLREPGASSLLAGRVVHQMIANDFASRVNTGIQIGIPGASASPLRSSGLCGGNTPVIRPQSVGGRSGLGFPDLASRGTGGVLQVAEIKPAVLICLIDGEDQLLRYIDQGNARDPQQAAWRASEGITVVSPMLTSTYEAPTLTAGPLIVQTAWCTPGLLGYVVRLAEASRVPVAVDAEARETERRRLVAEPRLAPALAAAAGTAVVAIAGRALWQHFWRVVITRFAIRGAIAAAMSLADGPLPFGELASLGLALFTIAEIAASWGDIWREADEIAAREGT